MHIVNVSGSLLLLAIGLTIKERMVGVLNAITGCNYSMADLLRRVRTTIRSDTPPDIAGSTYVRALAS